MYCCVRVELGGKGKSLPTFAFVLLATLRVDGSVMLLQHVVFHKRLCTKPGGGVVVR